MLLRSASCDFRFFSSIIYNITACFFGDPVARFVAKLLDIRWETEWKILDNGEWIVFQVFGKMFEILGV